MTGSGARQWPFLDGIVGVCQSVVTDFLDVRICIGLLSEKFPFVGSSLDSAGNASILKIGWHALFCERDLASTHEIDSKFWS
jgi:hypothetical protein